ncbi:hypothetical protein QMK17_02950 [Rhodococcus sp. G-MC3]|uniref:hypothetical protein n=1 Tax=Rhodococcus sp. G-MC3 TaxID=3046209 RepID=UPI0024BB988E|nr:hypothetical protein [Rhodococcus sp. G-MC3]MDJ0392290.1 hypothetical protein [Rhodococcus sp. G-MC3]
MRSRLHPTDAQSYWMSAKIPNDQFLLFCFETDAAFASVREPILHNALLVEDLNIRIADVPLTLGYPRIVPMAVGTAHIIDHDPPGTWDACTAAVAGLFEKQLDQHESPWRLHLFAQVQGAPRCTGSALVAVLQISHALGDGRVATSLARRLFGDTREPALHLPERARCTPREAIGRARSARELDKRLADDVSAGLVPPQAPGRPKIRVNVAPSGPTSIRTIVRPRSDFTGVSVTVGAITAVSLALSRYLAMLGDGVPTDLGAELTLGKTGERRSRNHFRNAGIGLHPDTPNLVDRAERIAGDIADRRARGDHPAQAAQSLATELVPAALLHWGVRQLDTTAVPDTVTGNTVVSSVSRGDADLYLGDGPVRFTAGFPGLSPIMGLTHGVHGIGSTMTLSVTSSESAIPDPDVYDGLLRAAVDEVSTALQH